MLGKEKRRCGAKDEMEESGGLVGARISPNPQDRPVPSLNSRGSESTTAEAIVGKKSGATPQRKPPRDDVPPTQGSARSSAEAQSRFDRNRERRGEKKNRKRKEEKEKEGKGAPPRPGQAGRAARGSPVFSPRAQGTRRGIYGQQGETYLGYYTPSLVKCLA